jgi:hypothetical protein
VAWQGHNRLPVQADKELLDLSERHRCALLQGYSVPIGEAHRVADNVGPDTAQTDRNPKDASQGKRIAKIGFSGIWSGPIVLHEECFGR